MDNAYQKVIDSELMLGRFNLGPTDDEECLTYAQHKEIVEKILLIVAKDSFTDAAKRFIITGRKVFNRKRRANEGYAEFAERFRGAAQEHLICFAHTQTTQEKQQIALVLLDNAALQDSIYNNLLTIMVNKADDTKSDSEKTGIVSDSELRLILDLIDTSNVLVGELAGDISPETFEIAINKIDTELNHVKDHVMNMVGRIEARNPDHQTRLNFDLEDAIDALKTIRSDEIAAKPVPDTEPRKALSNLMISKGPQFKKSWKGRDHGYNSRKNSRCAACGKIGHWARDRICPLYGKGVSGRKKNGRKESPNGKAHHKKVRFIKSEDTEEESSDESDNQRNGENGFFRN